MTSQLRSLATTAPVAVHRRWTGPIGPMAWTARAATGLAATLLALAGLTGLALALLNPETILGLMLRMQQDINPNEPYFSLADIIAMQRRGFVAGLCYLVLAAALVAVGPRPWAGVLADAAASARRPHRISRPHVMLLLAMTSVAAALALLHAGQVMRHDEAISFLHYGTRSPLVALGFGSTNNHILHSLLMRLSVVLFGTAEWAIRLPALLAAVAGIPAIYLAARRQLGEDAALVAAALAAGSVYLIDLATNARGYSLVNLCFLLILALLPAVLRRQPAAWVAFVLLAGLGVCAVPIMSYPFAVAVIWLLVRGLEDPPGVSRLRWLREVTLGVAATGAFVLLLYSPVLVVTGAHAPEREGHVVNVLRAAQEPGALTRIRMVRGSVRNAWEQWSYPAPDAVAWLLLFLVALGWIMALVRGGHARALAIGAVLGPAGVLAVTALAAPPWWSLTFGFVLAILFAAVPVAAALRPFRPIATRSRLITATVILLAVSIGTLASSYPEDIPHYYGYRDARYAAAFLDQHDLHNAWIVATFSPLRPSTNYYLFRLGHGSHTIRRDNVAPRNPARLLQLTADREFSVPWDLLEATEYRLRRADAVRLPDSWLFVYELAVPHDLGDLEPQALTCGRTGGDPASVAAIDGNQAPPGEASAQAAADQRQPVAILDVGHVDDEHRERAERGDQDVALAPVHTLAGVPAGPACGWPEHELRPWDRRLPSSADPG